MLCVMPHGARNILTNGRIVSSEYLLIFDIPMGGLSISYCNRAAHALCKALIHAQKAEPDTLNLCS